MVEFRKWRSGSARIRAELGLGLLGALAVLMTLAEPELHRPMIGDLVGLAMILAAAGAMWGYRALRARCEGQSIRLDDHHIEWTDQRGRRFRRSLQEITEVRTFGDQYLRISLGHASINIGSDYEGYYELRRRLQQGLGGAVKLPVTRVTVPGPSRHAYPRGSRLSTLTAMITFGWVIYYLFRTLLVDYMAAKTIVSLREYDLIDAAAVLAIGVVGFAVVVAPMMLRIVSSCIELDESEVRLVALSGRVISRTPLARLRSATTLPGGTIAIDSDSGRMLLPSEAANAWQLVATLNDVVEQRLAAAAALTPPPVVSATVSEAQAAVLTT